MTKRIRSACVGVALTFVGLAVPVTSEAHAAGASSSRSCLSSAARSLLGRIEQKFGAMQLVSTCRPGARIAGTGHMSRHASGNAVDFNAGSRKGAVIQWLLANHHSGGTMTYPNMDHVHVDIGPRFVSLAGSRTRVAGGSPSNFRNSRMSLGGPRSGARQGGAHIPTSHTWSGRFNSDGN